MPSPPTDPPHKASYTPLMSPLMNRLIHRFLLPSLVCVMATLTAMGGASCRRQSFEKKLALEIERFNVREAPQRKDSTIVLDSLVYLRPSSTVVYHYTLEGMADNPSLLTPEVLEMQRAGLLEYLRGSIQLRPYKEHGVSFGFVYHSQKTGGELMRFSFSPKDYMGE